MHEHLFLAVNDNFLALDPRSAFARGAEACEGGDDVEGLELGAELEAAVDDGLCFVRVCCSVAVCLKSVSCER